MVVIPRLSPSLRALNAARLAACPEMERAVLTEALDARETHRRQGRAAKRSGDVGEAWAHAELDAAVAAGRLVWWRAVGPRTRHVGSGRDLRLITVGVGPCDVVAMAPGGRTVVAEIKRGSVLWRSEIERKGRRDPAIAPHQAEQLEACSRGGGIALVAVELAGHRRWLPWEGIPWRTDGSLRAQDVARITTPTLAEILEIVR